jgi:hypothetical protein
MDFDNIKYNCDCGFSCRKLNYFKNHKLVCFYKKDKLDNIIDLLDYNQKCDIDKFWNLNSDRLFILELYPQIGEYVKHKFNSKILDIGFENYNIINYELLENSNITYFQLEPFIENKIYKNDKLLNCKVTELLHKYPEYSNYFKIIIDFGVLGNPNISKNWNKKEISEYIKNIYNSLDNTGIYFLKIDYINSTTNDLKLDFEDIIYSYFIPVSFNNYQNNIVISKDNIDNDISEISKTDKYKFLFLEKKKIINNLVIVAYPNAESIWCDEKLNENTLVIVVFGLSKFGVEVSKIKENEFMNAMKITGCSYEFWNFPEKKIKYDKNITNEISIKIIEILNKYKDIESIYTHNENGEFGHFDSIMLHKIMKNLLYKYYENIFTQAPKIYKFSPNLKKSLIFKESEIKKKLLDCYKLHPIKLFREIENNFVQFNIF